ncbi:MAG TPA: NADPH:quinone reductase [Mycobacteriales bacterium]|jgi:NADPH2:quinone reductase|nr:NADPH:quinone reductase [Mycobacteriales bacterium]
MQAIVYTSNGDPDVLQLTDRDVPEPGPGELRVRVGVSGINPTDWKARRSRPIGDAGFQIPNQDGAGIVDAVGNGVDAAVVGQPVWIWEAAQGRPWGTAAQFTVVPQRQAVLLPAGASLELGACLGVPFLTAHRCLTLGESMPDRLDPGALAGKTVLVQGGAGGVGNAAIQLARWADARIITTVSSPAKAQLAAAAGADEIIDYKTQDVVAEVRKVAPHGVDAIVEVSVARNASVDAQVLGLHGAVGIYSDDGGDSVTIPIRAMMGPNARWQFVLVYTEPNDAKGAGIEDTNAAVADGAVKVGTEHGLPLHVFPLADAAKAHAELETAPTGRVLVHVADL